MVMVKNIRVTIVKELQKIGAQFTQLWQEQFSPSLYGNISNYKRAQLSKVRRQHSKHRVGNV